MSMMRLRKCCAKNSCFLSTYPGQTRRQTPPSFHCVPGSKSCALHPPIYTRIILDIGDSILKPDNGDEWQKGFEAIRVSLPNISKFVLGMEFVGGLVSSFSKQGLIETVLRLMRIFRGVRNVGCCALQVILAKI